MSLLNQQTLRLSLGARVNPNCHIYPAIMFQNLSISQEREDVFQQLFQSQEDRPPNQANLGALYRRLLEK